MEIHDDFLVGTGRLPYKVRLRVSGSEPIRGNLDDGHSVDLRVLLQLPTYDLRRRVDPHQPDLLLVLRVHLRINTFGLLKQRRVEDEGDLLLQEEYVHRTLDWPRRARTVPWYVRQDVPNRYANEEHRRPEIRAIPWKLMPLIGRYKSWS